MSLLYLHFLFPFRGSLKVILSKLFNLIFWVDTDLFPSSLSFTTIGFIVLSHENKTFFLVNGDNGFKFQSALKISLDFAVILCVDVLKTSFIV